MPPLAREVLQTMVGQLRDLEGRLADLDRRLVALTRSDPVCRALAALPGVGPVIATAFVATVPDASRLRSGRHPAAWLGLVPAQHSTGGKPQPLGLSKRGDACLRRQLMHGARALVRTARGRPGRLGAWIDALLARRPFNVVVAAVANKLARIVWAMLCRGEAYRAARPADATMETSTSCEGEVRSDGVDRVRVPDRPDGPRPAEPADGPRASSSLP